MFLRAADGATRRVKLTGERSAPAQRFVLETIRPSKIVFRTACGKRYFECAKDEPPSIRFDLPSISLCLREGPCSVYVWRKNSSRFQEIRMND